MKRIICAIIGHKHRDSRHADCLRCGGLNWGRVRKYDE